jgi:hypothetical protein
MSENKPLIKNKNSKRNRGYSKAKQAEVEDQIRKLIGCNCDDYEIQKILNLQPHIVRHYKNRIYAKAKVFFESLTPEMVLVGFAMNAQESIEELEWVKREGLKTGTYSLAHVQAVRLQHRIENDVIRLAQTLGLLPKRARHLQVANIHFQKHAMADIRIAVQHEVENILAQQCG